MSLLTSLAAATGDGPDAMVIEDTATPSCVTTRARLESVELLHRPAISDEPA